MPCSSTAFLSILDKQMLTTASQFQRRNSSSSSGTTDAAMSSFPPHHVQQKVNTQPQHELMLRLNWEEVANEWNSMQPHSHGPTTHPSNNRSIPFENYKFPPVKQQMSPNAKHTKQAVNTKIGKTPKRKHTNTVIAIHPSTAIPIPCVTNERHKIRRRSYVRSDSTLAYKEQSSMQFSFPVWTFHVDSPQIFK